jgi:hypothetical protein
VFHAVAHNRMLYGHVIGNLITLIEHPDHEAIAGDDVARVWCEASCKGSNQGGFTFTVATHHANAVAIVDANGDAIQYHPGGVFHTKIIGAQQMSHWLSLTCRGLGELRRVEGYAGGRRSLIPF